MKDKFSKHYIIFTIIYGILGLLQLIGYYLDNLILKIIITLVSNLDIIWIFVSIIYLIHVIKKKLDPKYLVLPISYTIYFIVFFITGILLMTYGIIKNGNILYFMETDSIFNQIIWILSGFYNIFQIGYSYYLTK